MKELPVQQLKSERKLQLGASWYIHMAFRYKLCTSFKWPNGFQKWWINIIINKKKKKWWINIRGRRSGSCWIGHMLSIIRCQETKSKSQSCSLNCCTIEIMLIGKETPYLFMRIGMISNMASEPFVLCVWVMNNPVYPWFSEAIKGIEMCLLTDRYSFSF